MKEKRDEWASRFGFLMAAAGSAIGLGNIWRFPYITGKFGGAAFVAFYLLVGLTFGLSITIAEWAIGRAGRSDSVGSFKKLGGNLWSIVGWFGFISAFVILSYYSVISGWIVYYIKFCLQNLFHADRLSTSDAVFTTLITSPKLCITFHLINMALVVAVTIKGVSQGIERICKVLMPSLFAILLILVVRSLTLEGAMEGVKFYLVPNFHNLGTEGMLAATGQSFYSLSLAMGISITYGSYLKREEKIPHLAPTVVFFDTLVAFLAGLVIFPACFATGIVPGTGPGLAFVTLPRVFAQMPFGGVFATAFFVLFYIAAITSAIALFEVVVAYGIDQLKLNRRTSALVMGFLIFALGVPSATAEAPSAPRIFGKGFLDAADFVINNWFIPVTAIFICIFVGWVWNKGAKDEITNGGAAPFKLYPVWLFICRFVAPVILAILLVNGGKW